MIRLLLAVCGVLAAAVGLEVIAGPSREDTAPAVPQRGVTLPAAQHAGPAGLAPDQAVAVMLGRPLFAFDRKPTGEVRLAGVELPRLAGIIASPGQMLAIFQPPGNVKPVLAQTGQTISGWDVMSIAQDGVGLRKAGNDILLRPAFTGAAPRSAAAVAAKPARWEAAAPTGVLRNRWSDPHLQP